MIDLTAHSHRRYDPLTQEWILVSPHRTQRPWQGQVEKGASEDSFSYDPTCYLCPTNSRAGNAVNPDYKGIFVFQNDFQALQQDVSQGDLDDGGILVAKSERGICNVICFSPEHDLTLARMSTGGIRNIVDAWAEQYRELGELEFIKHVQIFENRGEMMGCSNPHPHGQIWATENIPNEAAKEIASQKAYFEKNARCLLCDYLKIETEKRERVICENDFFSVILPFWAIYPYEVLIIGKTHRASIDEFTDAERSAFAEILKSITVRYDNLFQTPFPYSMGFHQKPTDGVDHPSVHFHAHFYPPLLRSATVRKFMVGFELLGSPQRDITPEYAAERLRELSETHYTDLS